MLRDSLKWMAITLFAVAAVLFTIGRVSARVPMPAFVLSAQPETAPSASPSIDAEVSASPDASALPTATPSPVPSPTPEPDVIAARVNGLLAGMTTSEKIGQLVMFGFSGVNNPGSAYAQLLSGSAVGNVCLYGANIASADEDGGFARAKKLLESVESENTTGIPRLVAIDVEGGSVVRFRWGKWPSSAKTLGKKNDVDGARAQFYTIGTRLKETGINMDLAPVLDVAEDPSKTFLKTRIISASADVAAKIGASVIAGLHDANCLSAVKHFPGHGGTPFDSHNTTPVIDKTLDELLAYDLVPFAEAIAAGADVTLVSHISFPAVDPEHIASQSSSIITGLLREKLRFDGVVMSDDFRMRGLSSQCDVSEAAVNFIAAGGDLILCGPDVKKQEAILLGLKGAVDNGTLSESRIDESVARILEKKLAVCDWVIDASRVSP